MPRSPSSTLAVNAKIRHVVCALFEPGELQIVSRTIRRWIKEKDRTGGILGGKDIGSGLFLPDRRTPTILRLFCQDFVAHICRRMKLNIISAKHNGEDTRRRIGNIKEGRGRRKA
jgi:hypothetical protein